MRSHLLVLPALLALVPAGRAQTWADVYDPAVVRLYTLDLDPADWSTVRNDTTFSVEVPARFAELGEPPILVGVRRKSGTALGPKVSLKIDINEFVPGQSWRDLRKLSLENGDDEDVISEGFGWLLHRLAAFQTTGLWTPFAGDYQPGLAAWCGLIVNGSYLGVYVNVEQPDKQFLRHRGRWTSGWTWLYKVSDIATAERKEGVGDSPHYQQLCYSPFENPAPCPTPTPAIVHGDIDTWVDVDSLLTYAAVSAFHAGGDQLFSHGKNFFFFDRMGRKRQYVPWDLDAIFSSNRLGESIYGQLRGQGLQQTAYQQTILDDPVWRPAYDARVDSLLAGMLNPALLVALLDFLEHHTALPIAVQLDPYGNLQGNAAGRFQSLRAWVVQRAANVAAQIP